MWNGKADILDDYSFEYKLKGSKTKPDTADSIYCMDTKQRHLFKKKNPAFFVLQMQESHSVTQVWNDIRVRK